MELNGRPVVEILKSGASGVVEDVYVHQEAIDHIAKDHPNTPYHLVQKTVTDPDKVLSSASKNGSVVFLNETDRNRRGHPIRVPVKLLSQQKGILQTGFYAGSKNHGHEILWEKSGTDTLHDDAGLFDKNVEKIPEYDESADVLYISAKGSLMDYAEEDGDGIVWRYDNSDRLVGVTVLDFKEFWLKHKARFAMKLASFVRVDANFFDKIFPST